MATIERRIGTSGKTTWRVRVRKLAGPALTKSFRKKSDAEEWARGIEHKIDVGDHVPNAEARKRTLADAIDRYLTITLPRSKHRKSADEQTRLLAWWRAELGTRSLVSITAATIAEARDKLSANLNRAGKPVTGATVNRYVTSLSAVLTVTLKEYGWIQRNPARNVTRLADSKGRERFLSGPERTKLLEACDASSFSMLGAIVRLALATGARKGELMNLQWSGVDLDRRSARFLDTKNGDARTVPLAASAVTALESMHLSIPPEGAVIPYSVTTLDKAWQVARELAGLGDVRFHDLRHSAASYLAMSGASLMDIAAILGHKTLAMVKRYSHLSEQHTTAAVDRMAEKFLG
ncbi:MAG: site-specific integrase [Dokdonella sp.]